MNRKIITAIFAIGIFFIQTNCYAQPEIYDRNKLPNYGVKKQVDTSDINKIMNTTAVDANKKIYDFTNEITDTEEQQLINKINEFSKNNNVEFLILSDNNYYSQEFNNICNNQIKEYKIYDYNKSHVNNFYNYNDFGINYPNYSGIVFYINSQVTPCEDFKFINLFTYGDANNYLSQDNIGNLLNNLIPYLDNGKDYEGISNMLIEIEKIKHSKTNKISEKITNPKKVEFPWLLVIFDLFVSLIIVALLVRKNSMVAKESVAYNYIKRGSLTITNKKDRVIL